MRERGRRSSSEKAGRWLKLAGLWSVIIVAGGGFGVAVVIATTRPPDPFALCQRSSIQAIAATVVIVDPTDPLTEIHRHRAKTVIEAERDRLPRGGRLTIVTLNPSAPWEPIENISVCNPGKTGNPFLETVSHIEKRWQEEYARPIEAAAAEASNGPSSQNSPIITTIAAVLARPDFDARVPERRLVIVSDLLEYDKGGYSQLKGGDFWSTYQSSALAQSVRLDLRDVTVAVDYLIRAQYVAVQSGKHREFWQRLLIEAGAKEVSFVGMAVAPAEKAPSEGPSKRKGRQ